MTIIAHGISHRGKVRSVNEDRWIGDTDHGFFVVADGMGGHNAGEVASALAVEAIRNFLTLTHARDEVTWPYGLDPRLSFNGNRLHTSIKLANRRVFKVSESRDEYSGMGTTTVALLLDHDRLTYASIGDSRLYSFAGDRLQQLTRDDSWVTEILARDPGLDRACLANHPMRNVLTNVIGARDLVEVVVTERAIIPGELLLLSSDGLHGSVGDEAIAAILAEGTSVVARTERLVAQALAGAAADNITAVVVQGSR
jgi:serine/threonine protein phosphatase PrpC